MRKKKYDTASVLGSRWRRDTSGDDPLDLWRDYQRLRTDDLRNQLIEHYLPIVRYTAERLRTNIVMPVFLMLMAIIIAALAPTIVSIRSQGFF